MKRCGIRAHVSSDFTLFLERVRRFSRNHCLNRSRICGKHLPFLKCKKQTFGINTPRYTPFASTRGSASATAAARKSPSSTTVTSSPRTTTSGSAFSVNILTIFSLLHWGPAAFHFHTGEPNSYYLRGPIMGKWNSPNSKTG